MSKLWMSFAVAIFELWTATAYAEVLDKPADIIRAIQAGKRGAWFDETALRKCLEADTTKIILESKLGVLTREKESLVSRTILLDEALKLSEKQLKLEVDARQVLTEENDRLTKNLSTWYRNPVIVGSTGVLAGAAIVAVVVTVVLVSH